MLPLCSLNTEDDSKYLEVPLKQSDSRIKREQKRYNLDFNCQRNSLVDFCVGYVVFLDLRNDAKAPQELRVKVLIVFRATRQQRS